MASTPSKELPSEGQEQAQETEMEVQVDATNEQTLLNKNLLDAEGEDEQEQEKEDEEEKQKQETPAKPALSVDKQTSSQTTSATKRKFDALHARNAAADPSILEHEKNKKARASTLMKTPGTKQIRSAKPATKAREFSFARPTQSSANRTAAAAKDHARAKPTPQSARKPTNSKRTLAKPLRTSVPARTASAIKDKETRPHFSYTPYSGPLPPLTVESSFAPKGSQNLDHGPRTASPAKTKLAAIGRKPRPASAKKTKPQSSTAREANPPSSPTKPESSVNSDQNRSVLKEKVESQH